MHKLPPINPHALRPGWYWLEKYEKKGGIKCADAMTFIQQKPLSTDSKSKKQEKLQTDAFMQHYTTCWGDGLI